MKNRRSEEFAYDDLNRLTKAWLNGELIHDMTYHPNGNIDTKSDVGTYRYDTPRPHAMSGIDNVGEGVTNEKQFIEYSTFNKVSQIRQGIQENNISKLYNIYYGLDEQRIKTVYSPNFNTALTRYYFGSYEKEIDGDGNVTHIDYIYSPTGLALIVKNGTKYYTHTDLLGSIERITSATGSLVSEYAYTPWGGRILLSGVNITDRGYTGHEHLTPFGDDTNGGFCLINMNGRIYDPVLARFLSPDPYVQAPDFTQSFNRYAYGWNNPFKYTDPSGEFVLTTSAIIGISIGVGILTGGYTGYKIAESKGYNLNNWQTWGYMLGGGAIGGLAGWAGASASISASASVIAGGGNGMGAALMSGTVSSAISGGITNGGFTALAGGSLSETIGATIQGTTKGAITGFVGAAAFQGVNQFFQNFPKPFVYKSYTIDGSGVLINLLPTNTLSYMAGSTAAQITSNLLNGNKPFQNIDYGLNLGILFPLAIDVTRGVNAFQFNMAQKYNRTATKLSSINDLLSKTTLNNNGDLNIEINAEGWLSYENQTGNSNESFDFDSSLDPIFSGREHTECIQINPWIQNYRTLIQMLYNFKRR